MIGNIVPSFQACNYGCFFWGWTITTDLQCALLIPFYVVIYKWKPWLGHAFCWIVSIVNTAGSCILINQYGFRAGPLAEENYYIFAYLIQKPFFKLASLSTGVWFAFLYVDILHYRRVPTDAER